MGANYVQHYGQVWGQSPLAEEIREFLNADWSMRPKSMIEKFEELQQKYYDRTCDTTADVTIQVDEHYGGTQNFY